MSQKVRSEVAALSSVLQRVIRGNPFNHVLIRDKTVARKVGRLSEVAEGFWSSAVT